MHPCLTPVVESKIMSVSPILILTIRSEWNRIMSLAILGGVPSFPRTMYIPSLGRYQKLWQDRWQLPKCLDRIHVDSGVLAWLRKCHHAQPLWRMKLFCSSRLSVFRTWTEIRLARIEVMTLTWDLISMMPRQLSRFLRSPFFGKIFNLFVRPL